MEEPVSWRACSFEGLSGREVHDIMRLRVDVFVVEQRCVYPEIDGKDLAAVHILGTDVRGELVAYARILPPHGGEPPHIGRVIVHPKMRGRHLGRHLMHQALLEVEQRYPGSGCALAAQAYLVDFYSSFGFAAVSAAYMWDGIPHVAMMLQPRRF